jgi:hypothetical protein
MKQLIIMIPETEEERQNHSVTHNFVTMDGRLTDAGEVAIKVLAEILCKASFKNSDAHGWYDELKTAYEEDGFTRYHLGERNFGEVTALIHSEVSEALESYRDHQPPLWYSHKAPEADQMSFKLMDGSIGKAEGLVAEFADVLIRIGDYCGAYKFSELLGEALVNKHAYNVSRPYKHGGKAM